MSDEFTVAEIEAMRKAVRKHDSELDPNGNPKEPYVHQEFPKMVYDHETSEPSRVNRREEGGKIIVEHVAPVISFKIVKDEKELAAALKEGFVEEAPEQHPPAPKKEKAPKAAKEPKKGKKGEQSEEASE